MKKIILAMQHLLAMFGATVLVPQLTGFSPTVAIFCAGVGTLIFHKCTDNKVPVFLGSSFAFIPLILTVKEMYNGDLSYAQGGIMVAGLIYVIMSFVIKKVGAEKIKTYFPAQVTGPMIIVIGLNLIPTAIDMASQHYLMAAITLSIALIINIFGKGFIKQIGILIAVGVGYIISLKLNLVDTSLIANASLIQVPQFTSPKFSIEAIIVIAPVVLAVFMEHIGDMTTNGAVVGKNFIQEPGLHRTLMGDGIATMFAGLMGGPANTTYGENTAVLAITKNYNPAILRLTAVFAICLSFIGKVGGILQSVPTPVMGGISLMLFSMISFVGAKTVKDSNCLQKRNNIIISLSILIVGLGTTYLSGKGIVIGIPVTSSITITGLSLAAIVGIVMNLILNRKDFIKAKEMKLDTTTV